MGTLKVMGVAKHSSCCRPISSHLLAAWLWAAGLWAAAGCQGGSLSALSLTPEDKLQVTTAGLGGGTTQGLAPAGEDANQALPRDANTPAGPTASLTTFGQGLFRGQDPRLNQVGGIYYFVGYNGQNLSIWKQRSLLDRGVAKNIGPQVGGALSSPVYIDKLGGQSINAWFIFGSQDLYRNPGADPYDNADQWARVGAMPWTDLQQITSVPFDFEVFQNPQDGPYKDRWYLAYVRNDPSFSYAENVHITEITAIGASGISLSNTSATADNKLIDYQSAGWTDIIAEAPGVAIHGQSVTLTYAGNGAPTSLYAVGLGCPEARRQPAVAQQLGRYWRRPVRRHRGGPLLRQD